MQLLREASTDAVPLPPTGGGGAGSVRGPWEKKKLNKFILV